MKVRTEIDNFSIDCVVFGFDEGVLKTLFIKRNTEPEFGKMALPGGFVFLDEDLDAAPMRRLHDLTGLDDVFLEQVGTFGRINRYPLRRVVTVVYYALIRISDYSLQAGQDALDVQWIPITDVPDLIFDHNELFKAALQKLQEKVRIDPIIFNLLPEKFTLHELQSLYESVVGLKFDKRNFRKKIQNLDILNETGEKQKNVSHRAARLFRFDEKAYAQMIKRGQMFSI